MLSTHASASGQSSHRMGVCLFIPGDGLTTYIKDTDNIKDTGNLPWQETSRA